MRQPDFTYLDSPRIAKASEYLIGHEKENLDLPDSLDAWTRRLAGMRGTEIMTATADRFSDCDRRMAEPLLELLGEMEPRSIVQYDGAMSPRQISSWVVFDRAYDGAVEEGFLLVPPRFELRIDPEIEAFVSEVRDLREFLHTFSGISEVMTPSVGTFLTEFDQFYGDPNLLGRKEFDVPRILLLGTLGGDALVVDEKGRVDWWLIAKDRLSRLADSLEELVSLFVTRRRERRDFTPYP